MVTEFFPSILQLHHHHISFMCSIYFYYTILIPPPHPILHTPLMDTFRPPKCAPSKPLYGPQRKTSPSRDGISEDSKSHPTLSPTKFSLMVSSQSKNGITPYYWTCKFSIKIIPILPISGILSVRWCHSHLQKFYHLILTPFTLSTLFPSSNFVLFIFQVLNYYQPM